VSECRPERPQNLIEGCGENFNFSQFQVAAREQAFIGIPVPGTLASAVSY
jgi:hypothetical protein